MAEEQDSFDMDAAVDAVGAGLGLSSVDDMDDDVEDTSTAHAPEPKAETPANDESTEPSEPAGSDQVKASEQEGRAAPQSWAKTTHDIWNKLPLEAQTYIELREKQMHDGVEAVRDEAAYGRQLRAVTEPFRDAIAAQGVSEAAAIHSLLNSHAMLTTGTIEQRQANLNMLARNLGLAAPTGEQPQGDSVYSDLEQKIARLEQSLYARDQAQQHQLTAKIAQSVEAFEKDPKNIYFDQIGDEIVKLVSAGYTLEEAYERGVWANPVTRALEQARLIAERDAKAAAKTKQEAEAAKKASNFNVRGRDTRAAPTGATGTMEDTMRSTLREIKSRAH